MSEGKTDDPYDLMHLAECSCVRGDPYADGSLPRFHHDLQKAIFDFQKHKARRPLYWGVHFQGLHIMTLKGK